MRATAYARPMDANRPDINSSPPAETQAAGTAGTPDAPPTRRQMLALGAVGASMVVSVRPAFAATATSILNCQLPVPDASAAGKYIAPDGRLVPPRTNGAFAPAATPFRGEDVRSALNGGRSLPGTSYQQSQAYLNYIRRLQRGQQGFTCFASIQMPGR